MTATYDEAVDQMYELFTTQFTANAAAIVGYVPEIRYLDDGAPGVPDRSKVWVRISPNPILRGQASLSNDVFEPGQKMYTTGGLLFIQVFFPKSYANAAAVSRKLGQMILGIFKGTSTEGCVWFRNTRVYPVAPEELFYRSNVVTEYQYDEIG